MATAEETQPKGEPNEKLIKVFDTKDESEAMVVHGLLESSGIESMVSSSEAQDVLAGVGYTVILAREEQAEEARAVIAAYRETPEKLELADHEEVTIEPEDPSQT